MISLLNVTKPWPVAAIFEMAAILHFFQLALYLILFSISTSIRMQHLMMFGRYLYDIFVDCHEAPAGGGHL
jgi:hypothetical protein